MYKDLKTKRKILLKYIKNNPNSTYREIKENTKIKVERIFPGGMKEAYKTAKVPFSKSLSKRDKKRQIKDVINFIKRNPESTVTEIQNSTMVSIPKVFGSVMKAYKVAGVEHPKFSKLKKAYIFIRKNPLASILDLKKECGVDIYNYFKSMEEFYKKAGIRYIGGHKKRSIKVKRKIIEYIKSHPDSTQWEINKNCNTHVQEIFKGGIKEAYKKAGIKYPKEERENYGAMNLYIKNRALAFEDKIIKLLTNFGNVKRYFKTKKGIADAFIKIKNKSYLVEIKDYKSKPISLSDVKQLNKYINCVDGCNKGLLVCRIKGKKDKFYIGNNEIYLINEEDLLNGGVA